MSRTKTLPGPSRLSQVLAGLRTGPRLELRSLQNLKLTLAAKNDHFGARHFVNGQLPRIRYANPDLNIQVSKIPGNPTAEMILTFDNGEVRAIDMHGKWSTTIVEELMEVAGDNSWQLWKAEATASGHPLVPSEDFEDKKKATNKPQRSPAWKKPSFKQEFIQSESPVSPSRSNQESSTSRPKTGAAAVLP